MDELKEKIREILDYMYNYSDKDAVNRIMKEIEKYDNSCSMALEHIKEENLFDIETLNKFSIVGGRYEDAHFRLGEIAHHLSECDTKYKAYRNHSILNLMFPPSNHLLKNELKREFKKELADLFILLYLDIENNPSFKQTIDERLDKFIENMKNGRKSYSDE